WGSWLPRRGRSRDGRRAARRGRWVGLPQDGQYDRNRQVTRRTVPLRGGRSTLATLPTTADAAVIAKPGSSIGTSALGGPAPGASASSTRSTTASSPALTATTNRPAA